MKAQFTFNLTGEQLNEAVILWLKSKGLDGTNFGFLPDTIPGTPVSSVVEPPTVVKPVTPSVGAFPTDPKFFVNTLATIFALQADGKTFDPGDNGEGAFLDEGTGKPFNTRDPKLIGCSIPIPMFHEMMGADKQAVSRGEFKILIEGMAGHIQIVDLGPGRDGKLLEDRYLDRTYGLCKAMTAPGQPVKENMRVNYAVIGPDGKPMEIKGLEGPKLKP